MALLSSPPAVADPGDPAATYAGTVHGHERRAWTVGLLSFGVMLLELVAGRWLNSMALVSDGLHTSTHVGVMAVASGAYLYERRRRHDPRFAFGPGKVTDLAAFASGAGLAVVAMFIGLESLERLFRPEPILFKDAAVVATVGLVTGLVSAAVLHQRPTAVPGGGGRDLNLWAAYLHMLADVITSILALGALLVGAAFGWLWLDAGVGLINAAVVAAFAVRLMRRAAATLLDMTPPGVLEEARRRLAPEDRDVGISVWNVAPGAMAVLLKTRSRPPPRAATIERLLQMPGVVRVLVEGGRRG